MTDVWRANGRPDLTVELARSRREDLLRAITSNFETKAHDWYWVALWVGREVRR